VCLLEPAAALHATRRAAASAVSASCAFSVEGICVSESVTVGTEAQGGWL
jgi:hypothetical protein